jgi:hypothetical protein
MRLSYRSARLLAVGALVLLPSCGGSAQPQQAQPVVAPAMTIERFLRAVNQNDLDTMARLFGNRDGSVSRAWSKKEVDDRMFLMASILRHSDYTIGPEQIVPGRRGEAAQFAVTLVVQNNRRVQVPFTLVRSQRDTEWLIEDIPIDRVTRGT